MDPLKQLLDVVPEKGGPRLTLKLFLAALSIALLSVTATFAIISWADARMERHVRPVRVSQAETAAVVDHIADHMFRPNETLAREARGLESHDPMAIKKNARDKAIKAEKEEQEALSILGVTVP